MLIAQTRLETYKYHSSVFTQSCRKDNTQTSIDIQQSSVVSVYHAVLLITFVIRYTVTTHRSLLSTDVAYI